MLKKEFKEDESKRERRARRYNQILKENAQNMKLLMMLNSDNEDGDNLQAHADFDGTGLNPDLNSDDDDQDGQDELG